MQQVDLNDRNYTVSVEQRVGLTNSPDYTIALYAGEVEEGEEPLVKVESYSYRTGDLVGDSKDRAALFLLKSAIQAVSGLEVKIDLVTPTTFWGMRAINTEEAAL